VKLRVGEFWGGREYWEDVNPGGREFREGRESPAGVNSGKEVLGWGWAHRLNAIGDVLNQASSFETGVES